MVINEKYSNGTLCNPNIMAQFPLTGLFRLVNKLINKYFIDKLIFMLYRTDFFVLPRNGLAPLR